MNFVPFWLKWPKYFVPIMKPKIGTPLFHLGLNFNAFQSNRSILMNFSLNGLHIIFSLLFRKFVYYRTHTITSFFCFCWHHFFYKHTHTHSLSLSLSLYIYIYICVCLSLSLSIYIYIYICLNTINTNKMKAFTL